jgi:spore maturation protein CgeB
MHILIGYGYDPLTTGRYFEEALAVEHEVTYVGASDGLRPGMPANLDLERYVSRSATRPDLFLYIDSGHRPYLPYHVERLACPTAAYLIDVHLGPRLRRPLAALFDYVFVAQHDCLDQYRISEEQVVEWLPLACDPALHSETSEPRVYDVGFVGNPGDQRSRRSELLRELEARFAMNDFGRPYPRDEMARTYGLSKVVFNCSVGGEVNMRVFEAMASGALLITDRIENGLADLFQDGHHLVMYDDLDDLSQKITHYLGHDAEREAIAQAGRQEVLSSHTYSRRAQQIFDTVFSTYPGAVLRRGASQRRPS